MRRYLGCDAHATSCSFGVLSAGGKRLRHDVVETSGRALIDYLRQIPGELHVCLEEGEQSQWMVEVLSPHVAEVVVVVPERKSGSKSDRIDAFGLADVLATGKSWKRVFKDPHRYQKLRELSRLYRMVTSDVVRTKNRVKGFYRSRGLACAGEGVYLPGKREARLSQLPAASRSALEFLYGQLDQVQALKGEAEAALIRESRRHRIARILETAPGLGPIRVAQMLPIVVTPHRFRTSRQFWAYCGFGVVTRSSSDYVWDAGRWVRARVDQTRGLNSNHNHTLKAIFKGAATTICMHAPSHPLHDDYEQLLGKGIKPNLAKLTIARKLAALVLAMWKQEQRYDPKRRRAV